MRVANCPKLVSGYFRARYDVNAAFGVEHTLPDKFWSEKILLLLDYLQLYGILWNCANPYPWPYLWIIWTRNICFFNLDFFSLQPTGALGGQSSNITISKWGTVSGYGNYAIFFSLLAALLTLAYILLPYLDKFGSRFDLYHDSIRCALLSLGYILYAPINLAVRDYYIKI